MFSLFTNVTKYKVQMRTRGKLDNAKDAMKKMRKNLQEAYKKRKKRKAHSVEMVLVQPLSRYAWTITSKIVINKNILSNNALCLLHDVSTINTPNAMSPLLYPYVRYIFRDQR